MYRIIAKIKGYFRRRRLLYSASAQYHVYGSGVTGWHGWFEDDKGCIAFADDTGLIHFDW